ncbi:leucine-rich repeat, cysteine-containing subtype protein [Tanacetum coccineum]
MKLLAQSCVKLTRLDLGGECLYHLDDVNLKGRSRVGDVGVGSFVRSFKNLKFLSLKRFRISDDGIHHLKQMVGLEYLDLSKCGENVTRLWGCSDSDISVTKYPVIAVVLVD